MSQAFFAAGIPRQAIAIYPGGGDIGAAVLKSCPRSSDLRRATDRRAVPKGTPGVQVHGPGFSKILFGEDTVDDWEQYLDLMVDSVLVNSGRSCINCSGIWVPRHGRAIAEALAERLGPIAPLPPQDPQAALAAFTVAGQAEAISADIDATAKIDGVEEVTATYRDGDRLVPRERCDYLRPTVLHAGSPDSPAAGKEYMFPFVTVVDCPQDKMIGAIGDTLVATGITQDERFRHALLDATNIDRLNLGPVPTVQLNWLQPHEGNIVDFLYRSRAFQMA